MASTNMTEHLKLNQWIGSDKPKMADFNADNRKVDQAVGSHTADQTMHLTEAERAAWNKAIPIVGGYTGDGTPMRAVEMGVAHPVCSGQGTDRRDRYLRDGGRLFGIFFPDRMLPGIDAQSRGYRFYGAQRPAGSLRAGRQAQ